MKNLISLILITLSFVSFAQDSIKVTHNGITNGSFKTNLSDKTIFDRSINWVHKTYNNPDKIITGKVDSKSITISGFSSNAWHIKMLGSKHYYDMNYQIFITINNGAVAFNFVEGNHYTDGTLFLGSSKSFFKSNGECRPMYNTAKEEIESIVNTLWFSYFLEVNNSEISSDEAISLLKKAKEKLDLGLISQEDYDKKKAELGKYIK